MISSTPGTSRRTQPLDELSAVTYWLQQLQAGNLAAAQPLWERYFGELVRLARARLDGTRRGMADEEDVALSAFDSFCRGVAEGQFPQLRDRKNLWSVLVTITARMAINLAKHERRRKRGGGHARTEGTTTEDEARTLDQVVGSEPTPAFAAQVAEERGRLLALLENEELKSIATWKMKGDSNARCTGWCRTATASRATPCALLRARRCARPSGGITKPRTPAASGWRCAAC